MNAKHSGTSIERKLTEMGLVLPSAPKPVGKYLAAVRAGNLLFLSGQFPIENGGPRYIGRVGAELSESEGCAAARLAALNVLAQIRAALGGFEPLGQLARVEGHVASGPGWYNVPKILDSASDVFVSILGERGRHSRSAFAATSLPLNHSVKLVVTAYIKP